DWTAAAQYGPVRPEKKKGRRRRGGGDSACWRPSVRAARFVEQAGTASASEFACSTPSGTPPPLPRASPAGDAAEMHLTRDGSGSPAGEGRAGISGASPAALAPSALAPLRSGLAWWRPGGRAVLAALVSAALFFCVCSAQLRRLPSLSAAPPFPPPPPPPPGGTAVGNRAAAQGRGPGPSDAPRRPRPLSVFVGLPGPPPQALGPSGDAGGRGGGKAAARGALRPHNPQPSRPRPSARLVPAAAYPADAQFRSCKFLFPGVVGEQLTKGGMHFHQLALLARRLNRTLVLPNVADSRIESCLPYPFSTYFDVDALGGVVEWIDISEFVEILRDRFRNRPHGPGDLRGRLNAAAADHPPPQQHDLQQSLTTPPWVTAQYLVFSVRPLPPKADRRNPQGIKSLLQCYRESATNPTGAPANPLPFTRPTLNFFPPEYRRAGEADDARRFFVRAPRRAGEAEVWAAYARSVIATLQSLADVDVLGPYLFPADAETPLEYNPAFWARARRVASTYMARPFVAVHWRMETVDPRGMPACADMLARHLRKVKRELLQGREPGSDGVSVFLANDLPAPDEGGPVRPGATTFVNASSLYYAARRRLLDAVQGFATWRTLAAEDRRRAAEQNREPPDDEAPGEARGDAGALGILDKLVCSLADHFVAGPPGCSKGSSFTRQISTLRAGPPRWSPSDVRAADGRGGPGGRAGGGPPTRAAGAGLPGAQGPALSGRPAGGETRAPPAPRPPANIVDTWPPPSVGYVRQIAARYDVAFGDNAANLDDAAEWRGGP
ncbi:MAG: hypothetical protein BJ554DRAFT_2167, partial [Olpidium bornovanus]